MHDNEIWKDIKDYEGIYEISNFGNVRNSITNIMVEQFHIDEYKEVKLNKGSKAKVFKVHRLVAQAFLPNWNSNLYIDHIDTDKSNNHVSNLQMVTMMEHNRKKITDDKSVPINGKRSVHQIDPKTLKVINTYTSFAEAARALGKYNRNAGDSIRKTCTGSRMGQKAYGYFWELAEQNKK